MTLSTIIHARQDAYDRSKRRSAGTQAIIARNELIRRLRRQGVSDEEIARRYDIGVTTVRKIFVGKSGRTQFSKENEA